MRRLAACAFLSLVLVVPVAESRVISYAPVTDRQSVPAIQKRTNRYYALVERAPTPGCPTCPYIDPPYGQLVLHDSRGTEEPRVVFPPDGSAAAIAAAACHETAAGVPYLLVLTNARIGNDNPTSKWGFLISRDAGLTWARVLVPLTSQPVFVLSASSGVDRGGPVARANGSRIQPGNDEVAFFFLQGEPSGPLTLYGLACAPEIGARELMRWPTGRAIRLLGTRVDGSEALVAASGGSSGTALEAVPYAGSARTLCEVGYQESFGQGWVSTSGRAFVHVSLDTQVLLGRYEVLYEVEGGLLREAAVAPAGGKLFAIPTAEGDGAWVVQVGPGIPSVLSRYAPGGPLAEAWSDATAPEVEALHAGASGKHLLIQVHRPRTTAIDQRLVVDPALAVWEVGTPAPRAYDELFLIERSTKGFVHLDVDGLVAGSPFVFDGGENFGSAPPAGGPAGGGSAAGGAAVIQEWGVVKGSLRQRLLVPAVARTAGAHGAAWRTELLIHNPDSASVPVLLRFVPADDSGATETSASIAAGEIRRFPDVLADPLLVSSGSGTLFLLPPIGRSVNATSRTYTVTERGTFGMGVGALDVFTALSPRFSATFSAGLLGGGFRTNLVVADVSGRGSEVAFDLLTFGPGAGARVTLAAPPEGLAQLNDAAAWAGVRSWQAGGFLVRPSAGESSFGVIAIDNSSNDPSWFGPDLPVPVARTIPALVHADGARGARFRSDLYLTNPGTTLRTVTLAVKGWASTDREKVLTFSVLPRENRTIPEALSTLFGMTGVARLRFQSAGPSGGLDPDGVRVTSRTYTLAPDGSSYGIPLPPLNSFQAAGSGDTLEILGPVGGPTFRTNLALVDLTANPSSSDTRVPVRVDVHDETGARIDTFEVRLPVAGGLQIDDLFRARGLGHGPDAALIRVSPAGGLVAAYATTIDQGTNDPSYFAAQLAAKD